jgi:spermidine synthase
VVDIANSQFSYLANNPAHAEIHMGDARLTLDRQPPQQFDVLVVDAFSGDSVPAHLLTREAFAIYFRHLKPNGILAMHVSNRFLDLAPVVKSGAESFGKTVRIVNRPADASGAIFKSSWIIVSPTPAFFDTAAFDGIAQPIIAPPGFRTWTDDYSSIFAVLK